jgi:hypothetical protein
MADFHSPSLLQVIQRPQVWIPGSAALLTLLFLGTRVLNPNLPETADNAEVANDQASQQLTPEQSLLGSDIDNLDVLLNELKPGEEASAPENARAGARAQTPEEADSTLQPLPSTLSNGTLTLPSFTLNAPPIAPEETIAPGEESISDPNAPAADPNLEMRPAQLRNFFSNITGTTQPTTLAPLSAATQNTLNPSLPASPASNTRLFGSPQLLGLPQSNLSGTSPTAIGTTPIGNTPIGTTPSLTSSTSSSAFSVPQRPAPASGIPTVPTGLPASGSVGGSLGGPSANLGLPQSSSHLPSNNFSNNSLPPSPYSLDRSFTDPLAPPVQSPGQPAPALAPGQYIGNGQINTFANP